MCSVSESQFPSSVRTPVTGLGPALLWNHLILTQLHSQEPISESDHIHRHQGSGLEHGALGNTIPRTSGLPLQLLLVSLLAEHPLGPEEPLWAAWRGHQLLGFVPLLEIVTQEQASLPRPTQPASRWVT